MGVEVIGAGLSRTGTMSLKFALERLLGGPCYHMMETFGRPDDLSIWRRAFEGETPDWDEFLGPYRATVDLPAAAFWPELHDAYPEALVLLSVRDTDSWWASASSTVFGIADVGDPSDPRLAEVRAMSDAMWRTRFVDVTDEAAAKAAYERHNETVRDAVPTAQLIDWRIGDGWEPICTALGVPVPDEPFPHLNTGEQFRAFRAQTEAGANGEAAGPES